MQTLCIIQARMGSSRLPGKVMMPLAGIEVIWHVYNRVQQCKQIAEIVIATSNLPQDDVLAEYCHNQNWLVYRGSENDVLARYAQAAYSHPATNVVRVTSDCPLVDPGILSNLIELFKLSACDYASNNYPVRTFPVGTDCEIMTQKGLLEADKQASSPYDREHVTPYFYNNPDTFSICGLKNTEDQSHIRITLDTTEDYALLANIYDKLYQSGNIVDLTKAIALYESI